MPYFEIEWTRKETSKGTLCVQASDMASAREYIAAMLMKIDKPDIFYEPASHNASMGWGYEETDFDAKIDDLEEVECSTYETNFTTPEFVTRLSEAKAFVKKYDTS